MASEVQIFELIGARADSSAIPTSFLAKQTLTIGGAASAAFNGSAEQLMLVSTTSCVIEFGTAPDGLGTTFPIVAGQLYFFSVQAGRKVIAAAGTATAPATTTTVTSDSTEYTEDAVAAANPVGPVILGVRRDTLTVAEVSADGDNVALKASSRGQLHTIDFDANAVLGTTAGAAVVTDANGTIQQYLRGLIVKILSFIGPKAPSASLSVTPAGMQYETVAASQTAQALGATGATGDFLSHVIIQPTTTGAGTTTILDNATVIFTFTTGTLADLRPIIVPVGAFSVSGAWKITTGANVTATGIGNFT